AYHLSSPMSLGSLYCSWPAQVTNHQSQFTKSFTIRTSAKRACNSRRIRTSKTLNLKLFRMNTYEKTGEGVGAHLSNERGSIFEFPFSNFALSVPLHTVHYSLFSNSPRNRAQERIVTGGGHEKQHGKR